MKTEYLDQGHNYTTETFPRKSRCKKEFTDGKDGVVELYLFAATVIVFILTVMFGVLLLKQPYVVSESKAKAAVQACPPKHTVVWESSYSMVCLKEIPHVLR